jgi:hypothetical protein
MALRYAMWSAGTGAAVKASDAVAGAVTVSVAVAGAVTNWSAGASSVAFSPAWSSRELTLMK